MTPTNWKDIAELVGIAAIVASLIFVGLQLRQDQQVAIVESLVAGQFTEFEISRLIGENSEVWVRGLNNEDLTESEEATFEAISNAVFRLYASDYLASTVRGELESNNANSYAFFVYQYSGLRRKFYERAEAEKLRKRALRDSDENFSGYVEVVDRLLRQLDATSPEVPTGNYVPL